MFLSLNILAALVGVLLIGWSILLYEPEERAIDDALMKWWVAITDTRAAAIRAHTSLANRMGQAITQWLDNVFRGPLVSLHSAATSACLSVSSSFLFLLVAVVTGSERRLYSVTQLIIVAAMLGIFSVSYFTLAMSAAREHHNFAILQAGLVTALLGLAGVVCIIRGSGAPLAGLGLVIISDFSVIVLTRRSVRRIAASADNLAAASTATVNAGLGVAILWCPFLISRHVEAQWLSDTLQIAGATNVFGAAVASTFFFVSITLISQRLLWPLIARPIYAMHRFQLFRRRGLLFYSGVVLLTLAIPKIESVISAIMVLKQQ